MPTTQKPKPWSRLGLSSSIYASPSSPSSKTTNPFDSPRKPSQNGKPRLRPAPIQQDPLEAAGLTSKGDTVLLDLSVQETYFSTLQGRYMEYYALTSGKTSTPHSVLPSTKHSVKALEQSFEGISLDGSPRPRDVSDLKAPEEDEVKSKELSTLHMSMRKLREAILATHRADSFAQQVYTFIIRASILTSSWESYHPALLHILHVLHVKKPLSANVLHEVLSYYILDTACRKADYGSAWRIKVEWGFKDGIVEKVLHALVRDDWVSFWRVRGECDGYQKALLAWAEKRVRKHALKCVGKAYHSVPTSFVNRTAGGMEWEALVDKEGVGWDEEEGRVVIKRIVRKT